MPTAWYTLGAEDTEPFVAARGLFHALRLRLAGLVPDVSLAAEAGRGPHAGADEAGRAMEYAGLLVAAVEDHLRGDLVLVLDDVHEIEGSPAMRLIEALCRQAPGRLHIVLASRFEPPFPIERLRGQGQLVEVTSADLRFTAQESEALLVAELGEAARPLAVELQRRTEGWPAAVRLAAEALQGVPTERWHEALAGAGRAGGRLFTYLAEEVMTQLDPGPLNLIRTISPLDRVTPELAEVLGVGRAAALFEQLERRGLFLVPSGTQGWYAPHPVVRLYARERLRLDEPDRTMVLSTAADWLEARGDLGPALDCLQEVGDDSGIARLLTTHGRRLMAGGAAPRVAELAARLPDDRRTPAIYQLEGEARHAVGDWDGAFDCLSRLVDDTGPVAAAVAWRLGLIHHLRGELDLALAIYQRAAPTEEPSADHALVSAWAAAAWWLKGDAAHCRASAEAADAEARASGDQRAAAAAQTALAMLAAMEGDRRANDAHYVRALDHAERAGDVLQIIRIRANRGSRHVEEGEYEDALAELDVALRLADLTGFASWRALTLLNRGQALIRLGRLDEARRDLDASRATGQSLGSRMVSWPLASLGDLYAARGEPALARAAYEESLAIADPAGDVQGIVPARAGLARVLLPDDPGGARRHAERAVTYETSLAHQWALIALGRVALADGELAAAVTAADSAAMRARQRRDRAALAEALELQADIALDEGAVESGTRRLEEAREIHRAFGDPLGEARVDLRLAGLAPRESARRTARSVESRARLLGARGLSSAASRLIESIDRQATPAVAVEALGGFRVVRQGVAVTGADWQSRKARDLVKMLVARRGRPIHREELVAMLWPDAQGDDRTGSRLSVTLSTLRAVLDPTKLYDPDHFVAADRETVRLVLDHLRVDVETFLDAARRALVSWSDHEPDALEQLAAAEAAYTGDFLAGDPYEDWAQALRGEARSVYRRVVQVLARAVGEAGDADSAVRYLLRLLEGDAYDEAAHVDLVRALTAAGRHGEARRAYRAYCNRMEELEIEPAPFPRRPADGA